MDRAEDLIKAQLVLHRQHIFRQQFARIQSDNRHAKDGVLARFGQHFDKALGLAFSNCAVEIVNPVFGHFISDALLARLALVQTNAGNFRIEESDRRDHRVIRLKALELAEQSVDGGKPRLMARGVGELVRARHITSGIDVGKFGREEFVRHNGSFRVNPDIFQPISLEPRRTPDRDDQRIIRHFGLSVRVLCQNSLGRDFGGAVAGQHFDA